MSSRYNLYHKHTHYSNIFTPDTHTKPMDYIKRAVELGHTTYFTTEHGSGGDIFEARTLCDEHGLRCIFGVEGYVVENPLEKDKGNYHMVIIPRTNNARELVNLITSKASKTGFYYKPRIGVLDLLELNEDDIYITTACLGGILESDTSYLNIFLPLYKKFGKSMFLEVQPHLCQEQVDLNIKIKNMAMSLELELIAGTDSHYILPEDSSVRKIFLSGKKISYGDEDMFALDYPDRETFKARFLEQGVFSEEEIERAISNTLVFDGCEEILIDKEIKMPTIYPNLTADEKIEKLREHIERRFLEVIKSDKIEACNIQKYRDAIEYEFSVIRDTKVLNTVDYFLLDEAIVEKATTEYGGILSKPGRGSAAAYYLNRILGVVQVDRVMTSLPLFPERFISTARLLENRSLPDIDMNVVSQEPFIKATRDLLGDTGCYPMISYGTLQISEAFRNICRANGLSHADYNSVAKDLEKYKDAKAWKGIYDEALKFVDTIVSSCIHPCAFVLSNSDLERKLGVVRIGENICCLMTSAAAEEYKYLKNDYLVVSVWSLIAETFKEIDQPILSIEELTGKLDEKTWSMYEKGLTCTLNQVDGDWATSLVQKYNPKTIEELAMFVASIRPSFNSWREQFISRVKYTNGNKFMDEILFSTGGYILFQENLMEYFIWLGVSSSASIGLIKKISKKTIAQDDFDKLEKSLLENWVAKTGSEDGFLPNWNMVQSCISYGFAAPHGLAVAFDSLYGAYLKSHHPLQYYTVALNLYESDLDKTSKLIGELDFFGIKINPLTFRYSKAEYSYDLETNTIYKGIGSVKYLNPECADALYSLRDKEYPTFVSLLADIKTLKVNKRQLLVLIQLDFFSEFGNSAELSMILQLYVFFRQGDAKTIKQREYISPAAQTLLDRYAIVKAAKLGGVGTYQIENCLTLLENGERLIKKQGIADMTLGEKVNIQCEYLGYIAPSGKGEDRNKLLVTSITPLKRKSDGKKFGYSVVCISLGSGISNRFTVFSKVYNRCGELSKHDIMGCIKWKKDRQYYSIEEYRVLFKKNKC